ncbi:MAG: phosphatase PAP2 family protein [Actinomycetota bacterium]|nr:phosphatase PAP2 family protein [Actinomycetota bacterium]
MTRRAYGFAVGLAVTFGLVAWVASYRVGQPLRDPDGLAGPSYIRLPLIVILFFLADVVPRVLIRNRGFKRFGSSVKEYTKQRWTRSRIALVLVGLSSFYVVYVAYRNLKGLLPFVREGLNDTLLERLDRALLFGHYPATVLHEVLGTGVSAHVLSFAYTGFLLFVPVSLGAALVWSKNVSTGFWYVTALCINWVLGVASYYWLPAQGPYFANRSLFLDLPDTGVTALQDALRSGRSRVLFDPFGTDGVQSVAAFASLHVSIIFTAALICHYVIPNRWVRWSMWVYFVLTTVATIYFGWHYLLDDVAGLAIGWVAVWIGAKTTGHVMRVQRHAAGEDDGIIGVFPPETSPADDQDTGPRLSGSSARSASWHDGLRAPKRGSASGRGDTSQDNPSP